MEKIWLKNYPLDVPVEINPEAYQSIVDILSQSCKHYSKRRAFTNFGVAITYEQLDQHSRDLAAYFQHKLRLKKGDRVAIMMPNLLQYPIVMYAALRAGLIIVNVNPLYTADELVYQINNSGAQTLVVLTNFAHTVQEGLPRMPQLKNIILTQLGDLFPRLKAFLMHFVMKYIQKRIPRWSIPNTHSFRKALLEGKNLPFDPPEITNQDIAFLQYTGGTTGVSKGAILTHRNIVANIEQAHAWFHSILAERTEILITALPLYHIFSLTGNCLFFTRLGGLNVLITNPRDIPHMVKEMKKYPFTAITGVNTLFNALLKNRDFASLDFSHMHLSLGGGMAIQKAVADRWEALTHVPLLEAYGLTETSPCAVINPPALKAYNGSIGLPIPSTEAAILDNTGNELPIGEAGELAIKGPQVMQGYWNNPTETAKVFTQEGWLLTGDIATIDQDGFVRLLERKKDMILVSGFNVYPNEIEDVIVQLPGVREVAVVGVPDPNSSEVPKAFVVPEDPNLSDQDIIKFCRQHLTAYKIPKYVEFVTELPKSYVGKILRRALRDKKHT